ncbi:P-loop containing nucleoside triphosphate hydrolases superfamily protein isoform 1 [Balamuthia mandrillaris]
MSRSSRSSPLSCMLDTLQTYKLVAGDTGTKDVVASTSTSTSTGIDMPSKQNGANQKRRRASLPKRFNPYTGTYGAPVRPQRPLVTLLEPQAAAATRNNEEERGAEEEEDELEGDLFGIEQANEEKEEELLREEGRHSLPSFASSLASSKKRRRISTAKEEEEEEQEDRGGGGALGLAAMVASAFSQEEEEEVAEEEKDKGSKEEDYQQREQATGGSKMMPSFVQLEELVTKQQSNPEGPLASYTALVPNLNKCHDRKRKDRGAGRHPSPNGRQALLPPEMAPDVFSRDSSKVQPRMSSLSTYKCWKCTRTGHLPKDCTAFIGIPVVGHTEPAGQDEDEVADYNDSKVIYSKRQRDMYKRCQQLGKNKEARCTQCRNEANLVHCLTCDTAFCDSNGHLADHLLRFPSHNELYSYKLRRQVKCCKSTCRETNVYKLLTCSDCLDKLFDRHYSMVTASWSRTGLQYVPNALACDNHFEWHRMNCNHHHREGSTFLVQRDKLQAGDYHDGTISEHFF